ncbi:MAG: VWA domain-containing protein [Saprospirales bacterium]|nr:VWA domain-containing protein [Saprospirales bacterium]MBK8493065.1 VWA domain-containing protein [Saprospirales bacterium]
MPKTIQFTSLPGNRYISSEFQGQELYLYAELKGIEAPVKEARQPLNISLVIDRSGSMQGEKIAFVKEAVKFVINNLNPADHLSIVIYDDQIEVLAPSAPVANKSHLLQLVDTITSRNMTNLSGGMLEGYYQVQAGPMKDHVNRVLLLTDGLANRGITDRDQLQLLVQKKIREEGIALSTFGVGADFDELLLTNLSEYGGANYYFIESNDKIPEIFAEELKGLLAVVAQNAHLQITFNPEQVEARKVYGFPATIAPGIVRVPFNDLHSLEEKAVLVALQPKSIQRDIHYQIELNYLDVLENMQTIQHLESVRVSLTSDPALVNSGSTPKVLENIALFLTSDYYEQAVAALSLRDLEKAKELGNKGLGYIELYTKSYGWTPALKTLYDRLQAFMARINEYHEMSEMEQKMYAKGSSYSSYMSRRKKPF